MIFISCVDNINPQNFDQTWGIVRSRTKLAKEFMWVPQLSPSEELYKYFLCLRSRGEWDEDTFLESYVPQFLREMHAREAVEKLNELYLLDKSGYKVALGCFCGSEKMCHRSIVAGLLQGAGCNVGGVERDYSKYYEMYRERI